jgi:hypothetical protein
MKETTPSPLGNVITIDDERIKNHFDRVVWGSMEETLNVLLDAEADRLCNSAWRAHWGSPRYPSRALRTQAADQGRDADLGDQRSWSYQRRESAVEEALIVSVRRVDDITEALSGTRILRSTVSDLNKKIYGTIEAWPNRPIEGEHPYVYLDGILLSAAGRARFATCCCWWRSAVNGEGYREESQLFDHSDSPLPRRHEVLAGVDRSETAQTLPTMPSRRTTGGASAPTIRSSAFLREIRRRMRVVGAFPNGQSALNLAAARLRHIAGHRLSQYRAPLRSSMCEKLWTRPSCTLRDVWPQLAPRTVVRSPIANTASFATFQPLFGTLDSSI